MEYAGNVEMEQVWNGRGLECMRRLPLQSDLPVPSAYAMRPATKQHITSKTHAVRTHVRVQGNDVSACTEY